jgi:hypothetical protein
MGKSFFLEIIVMKSLPCSLMSYRSKALLYHIVEIAKLVCINVRLNNFNIHTIQYCA